MTQLYGQEKLETVGARQMILTIHGQGIVLMSINNAFPFA